MRTEIIYIILTTLPPQNSSFLFSNPSETKSVPRGGGEGGGGWSRRSSRPDLPGGFLIEHPNNRVLAAPFRNPRRMP